MAIAGSSLARGLARLLSALDVRSRTLFGSSGGVLAGLYALLFLTAVLIDVVAPGFASRHSRVVVHGEGDDGHVPTLGQCLARGMMEKRWETPSVARVKDAFDCGCRVPDVYEQHENPRVCAIVQSWNHVGNVRQIARALVENEAIDEIIVCEDGSEDGSRDVWVEELKGLRHFVVVSNNLHEVRCYNRAMRMSSAEFFVMLQDDDLPGALAVVDVEKVDAGQAELKGNGTKALPKRNWVKDALHLFDADPSLGVLTGFIGQLWNDDGKGFEFGEQQSDHGGLMKGNTRRIPFVSRATKRPFMYVECAWIAPLLVRASTLRRIGGLDTDVFGVGEPGMWQDCLLSYAAWTAGWRVGVYDAAFKRGVGGHGSTSSPEKAKMRNTMWQRAKNVVDKRFERSYIRDHVVQLNNATLDWRRF